LLNRALADANQLNGFFTSVSTDPQYELNEVLKFIKPNNCHDANPFNHFENYQIEPVMCKVTNTAPGCDNLPSWIFRRCSIELADVVAKLLNLSLASGNVYSNWKTAIVTPVPKVAKPTSVTDVRPISVTPILSLIAERLVVNSGYILPYQQPLFKTSLLSGPPEVLPVHLLAYSIM